VTKKTKNFLLHAAIFVTTILFGYFLTAFVTREFSPKVWGGFARGFAVLLTLCFAVLFSVSPFED
jgi:hypothetical protein